MNYFYCETCKKYWRVKITKINFKTDIQIQLEKEITETNFIKAKSPKLYKGICGNCRHESKIKELEKSDPEFIKNLKRN